MKSQEEDPSQGKKINCYNCGKPSHYKMECRKLEKEKKKENDEKKSGDKDTTFIVFDKNILRLCLFHSHPKFS